MPMPRRLATLAVTSSFLTAVAVTLAPSASAVGSSACDVHVNRGAVVSVNGANYRTGPSTAYSSKGLLYKGDRFRAICMASNGSGNWYYSQLLERSRGGLPKDTFGWVRADLARWM
jgi:SH3-like domain-containing protein